MGEGRLRLPRTRHYRSKALTLAQVKDAIAAYDFAATIGRPLNLSMDIHWQWTQFAQRNRRDALANLRESLRHFLSHRHVGFYSIAVREYHLPYGEHCHLLVHVPADLRSEFIRHVREFLRGGSRHQKKALNWEVAYYGHGKLAYILKGSTQPARDLLEQFNRAGERRGDLDPNQGIIYGKRLQIAQALGPKARAAASEAGTALEGFLHSLSGKLVFSAAWHNGGSDTSAPTPSMPSSPL